MKENRIGRTYLLVKLLRTAAFLIAKCTLFDVYCKIFMFANATKRAMDLEVLIAQITFGFLNINILVGCTVRNFVYSQNLKIIYDFKLTHTHCNKI